MNREQRFQFLAFASDLKVCASMKRNGNEEADKLSQFSGGPVIQNHSFPQNSLMGDDGHVIVLDIYNK